MKVTASITGVDAVTALLKAESRKWLVWTNRSNVEVGYSAYYAVYVHEDLRANHTNGQAKFLEDAVKFFGSDLVLQVENEVRKGTSLDLAVFRAAADLLAASKTIVPVRTGFLRDSGYVRKV